MCERDPACEAEDELGMEEIQALHQLVRASGGLLCCENGSKWWVSCDMSGCSLVVAAVSVGVGQVAFVYNNYFRKIVMTEG